MKNSKVIALAALTAAICSVCLVVGAYFPTFSLSAIFISSVMIMMPLAKDSYKAAILAVVASSLLAFLLASLSFETALPFLLFFGFHPIFNAWQKKKAFSQVWGFIIKLVWFELVMVLCYFVTEMFVTDNEWVKQNMLLLILIGGAILFIVYDQMMLYFQRAMVNVLKKLNL